MLLKRTVQVTQAEDDAWNEAADRLATGRTDARTKSAAARALMNLWVDRVHLAALKAAHTRLLAAKEYVVAEGLEPVLQVVDPRAAAAAKKERQLQAGGLTRI